jgi:shikimate kinase
MKDFGVKVECEGYSRFVIASGQRYKACEYNVEGDASSASYFYALEKLHGVKLDIQNINPDSLQADMGFLEVLGTSRYSVPQGTKYVDLPGNLDLNHMPDAAMTVAILAAFKKGKTRLTNIANLRHKETDRIKALVTELKKVGCDAKELEDGIEINGDPDKLNGPALIETYDDHRMAMCFSVLASKIPDVQILDPECTSKTYPQFFEDLAKTGIKVEKRKIPNIYLIGMRGSGKSAIGHELAKLLNFDFVDSDEEIERQEKSKISQIVKKKSWFYFRKKEKYVIRHLARKTNTVIATGGGVILDKENVSTIKKSGKIVLLTAPIATLEKRIANDTNRPPLTKQNTLKKELEELWAKRKEKYINSADFEFDSSGDLSLNEKARQIIQML